MEEKMPESVSTLRDCIEYAEKKDSVLRISKKANPVYEIASLIKAFDGGPLLIFENIEHYPSQKIVANLMGNRKLVAGYFGTTLDRLSETLIRSIQNPIQPTIVENPPCQENVITEGIDVLNTLPVLTHTPMDLGPVITGGVLMVQYPEEMAREDNAFNLSYHRLNPSRGPDWLTLASLYNRHFLDVLHFHKKRGLEYPVTVNIGLGPGLNVLAAGGTLPQIRSKGLDDLRVAGGLHGKSVRICKAKTIDAYAIADAEIVLEGKILYNEKTYEYDQDAHKDKKPPYFFPEFMGYEGTAEKAFKLQVTGITYRNDPYYVSQMGDSVESSNLGAIVSEASIYNACKNHAPDSFVNCHIPDPMRGILGVVIQCKTNHILETGISQGLVSAAYGAIRNLKLVVVVDEDVDLYDPADVLWALTLRTKPDRDINIVKKAGLGDLFETRWSVDTTVPFNDKWRARRPAYQKIDLNDFMDKGSQTKGLHCMKESNRMFSRRNIIKEA
jgi:UbiD family decarboxylase